MFTKNYDLDSMSLNDLLRLHEKVSAILSARIRTEKQELEKRLAALTRAADIVSPSDFASVDRKPRRQYPPVLPKYRNPQTAETWSGRGKRPRWLVAALKSGHKIEEFRITKAGGIRERHRA